MFDLNLSLEQLVNVCEACENHKALLDGLIMIEEKMNLDVNVDLHLKRQCLEDILEKIYSLIFVLNNDVDNVNTTCATNYLK